MQEGDCGGKCVPAGTESKSTHKSIWRTFSNGSTLVRGDWQRAFDWIEGEKKS
jgi:hypothetical protein